jgi:GNAT superfamily N-acetyltransferase
VVLGDGTRIGIRVLVPGDRDALAEAYEALSERSRRLRFFSPPKHLSPALLDYLTTLDYRDQFALVAFVEEDQEGIGLARWTRDRDHPTEAEAAVVVLDDWQHRGVGSALLTALIDEAVAAGIEVFTADVLWENRIILDPVRALGARIGPLEPGVARVEFDLPADDSALATSAVRRFLRDVAAA